MKKCLLYLLLLISTDRLSDLSDCQNVYVGRIKVEKGAGATGVVFLNSSENTSGSYWVSFSGWGDADRKEAVSLLLAAKTAKHRVNLTTESEGGCGITNGFTVAKLIYLATKP